MLRIKSHLPIDNFGLSFLMQPPQAICKTLEELHGLHQFVNIST